MTINQVVTMVLTIIGSVLASSGFWAYMQKKAEKKDVKTEMLIGLAHDRIVCLGMEYIERGDWITNDEYENLVDYLWTPYDKMGGNGSAKRVVGDVKTKLRLTREPPDNERKNNHV